MLCSTGKGEASIGYLYMNLLDWYDTKLVTDSRHSVDKNDSL